MKIFVLGSGTFQPTPERGCSGYLVEIRDKKIVLDTGSGVLRQLSKIGVLADNIDFIFYSHLHVDHTADLIPILFVRNNSPNMLNNLTIIGPPGFKDFLDNLSKIYGKYIEPDNYNLKVIEISGNLADFKDFRVTFLKMDHSDASYGIRIEENSGRVLSYSGDTDLCDNLVELCRDSNLSILECTSSNNNKIKGHLTPDDISKVAKKSGSEQILLSHISKDVSDEEITSSCQKEYTGNIIIAKELEMITL
ncbi:MBL fold metallo-hydrolase [candidate division KSB1 bacterium]